MRKILSIEKGRPRICCLMGFATLFFLFLILVFPLNFVSGADSGRILINEIMWKGAPEWIELYNAADKTIDVSGWKIINAKSGGGTLEIGQASISPNGYFLICDSKSQENCDLQASISLADSGNGDLILIDANNKEIDRAKGDKWPKGGDGVSMQRKLPFGDGGNESSWEDNKNPTPTFSGIGISANAGGNVISTTDKEITFDASSSKGSIEKYIWNFGDGEVAEGKIINHKYKISGNYIISLAVISGERQSEDTIKATIFPFSIFISEFSPKENWIEISNESGSIEDISGFEISNANEGGSGFIFPENSLIEKNGIIFISSSLLASVSFGEEGSLFLFYPSGDIKQEIKYNLPGGFDENWSVARKMDEYFFTKTPTPGKQNIAAGEENKTSEETSSSVSGDAPEEFSKVAEEVKEVKKPSLSRKIFSKNLLAQIQKGKMTLACSGLGVVFFSGFLGFSLVRLRRKINDSKLTITGGEKEREIIEVEIEK